MIHEISRTCFRRSLSKHTLLIIALGLSLTGLTVAGCNNAPADDDSDFVDGGWSPDVGDNDQPDTGTPAFTCPQNYKNCGGSCVNTTYSPDNCGGCNIQCGPDQSCDDGTCVDQPADCNQASCKGFAYCDLNSGECQQGCTQDSQCGRNETCDTTSNTCVCDGESQLFRGVCVTPSGCNDFFCSDTEYCDFDNNTCSQGCFANDQCGDNEICNRQNNECVCAGQRTRFQGECVTATECNQRFCSSDEYCNLESGNCESGCFYDDQCGQGEQCDRFANECTCTPDRQRFQGTCVTPSECDQQFCPNQFCDFQAQSCSDGCRFDSQCGSGEVCNAQLNVCECDSNHIPLGSECVDGAVTVDNSADVGAHASIDARSETNIQIAYYDQTNGDLKHARWDGSTWSTTVVDSQGDRGPHASIALDSQGDAHISYYDATNQNLMYAEQTTSGWSIDTVDSSGAVGEYTSISLDGSTPHIAYYAAGSQTEYKHATPGSSGWTLRTIEQTPASGAAPLATGVNQSGLPRVAYSTGSDIRFATFDGSAWSSETVDGASEGNTGAGIYLGSDTRTVAYSDEFSCDVNFGQSTYSNGAWTNWNSASIGGCTYSELSMGPAAVAYADTDELELTFYNQDTGRWETETWIASGVGDYLDVNYTNDRLYGVYYASNPGALVFLPTGT